MAIASPDLLTAGAFAIAAVIAGGLSAVAGTASGETRHREGTRALAPALDAGPQITAEFRAATGVLEVRGTPHDDTIVVTDDGGGVLLVNNGNVSVTGGIPTLVSTTLIRVLGFAGNDVLTLGPTGGFPIPGDLRGGAGDDTLTGGSGPDVLEGGPGNDVLAGRFGSDRMSGGPGDDRIVWNPGDSNDQIEGDAGQDTLEFHGSAVGETVELSDNQGRLRFSRNIANILLDVGSVERVDVAARGGADVVTVHDLSGTGVAEFNLDLSGPATPGEGDAQTDLVLVEGTPSADRLTAEVTTNTVAITGLSTAIRVTGVDPTLDRVTVDGAGGEDTLTFNGSEDSDPIQVSANGSAVRISGQSGYPVLDAVATEQVRIQALGSADLVVLGDLSATPVTSVAVDLAAKPGTGPGDGQPDRVLVTGTAGDDHVVVDNVGNDVRLSGLSAVVTVAGAEATQDRLGIMTLAGPDTIDASRLRAGLLPLDFNGGPDADVLIGSAGDDNLAGGQGNDLLIGGPGNDAFPWNPGDGSDVCEGGDGTDQLIVNGANIGETIDLSASGTRLRFTRNIANITLDCADTEIVAFRATGGADVITIGDLADTAVTEVQLDLGQPAGSGNDDGAPDAVIVHGTGGNDAIQVTNDGVTIAVSGLKARVSIAGSDATSDVLLVAGNAGDDTIVASGLAAGLINYQADGGEGNDSLFGSDGADALLGGPGDDLLVGGPGLDVLDGGTGSNVVVQ